MMPACLDNSYKTLMDINTILREPAKSRIKLQEKTRKIFVLMHNFKGESAALDMEQFVDQAQQFEDLLAEQNLSQTFVEITF